MPNSQTQIPSKLLDPQGLNRSSEFHFPGLGGLPFRGKPQTIDSTMWAGKEPGIGKQVFIERLELCKEEDLERYAQISQLAANGFAHISFEERVYDAEIKNWRVLIRWGLLYATLKPSSEI